MQIEPFYDPVTATLSYVVYDARERVAVVIDPVLDYDPASARRSAESVGRIATFLEERRLDVAYVLDTHAHADHVTALAWIARRYGAKRVIGAKIGLVQATFRDLLRLGDAQPTDGRPFEILLADGERLDVGPFAIEAIETPGHTPACLTYRVEDALFVGDTLFQPDYGTARCDFPGGDAATLHASITALYASHPPETRVFTGHDYRPGGRPVAFESTLGEQRATNVQLSDATACADFVAFRRRRDATLGVPALMIPSIQLNLRAGESPTPEANGIAYLRLPLDLFGS
ncbi:MAG: MBL fold metallo-hydrolase [Myxococcota bacterium]